MVISPHIYPPTITYSTAALSGADLFSRLSVAHGYLSKQVPRPPSQLLRSSFASWTAPLRDFGLSSRPVARPRQNV